MKTNSKNHPVFAYLLDCINVDGKENATPLEKCEDIARRLKIECLHKYNLKSKGVQGSIADWLSGLAINIAFYNCDIIDLAKSWGSIPQDASEKQEQKILDNYWSFMAAKLMQLLKFNKVAIEY